MSRPYSSAGSNSHPPYMDPRYQYPETPTTASTWTSDAQWAYGPGSRPYTGAGEDLYEEDESEDEDVFAYLPPTTAEQQAAQQQQQQQQQQMHIQPATAPLASVQPVTYPNSRPALSSPTPVLPPTTPVHPSAARHIDTPDSLVPPESFRMRTLKERVPRQNKTPEVHVSLEDPDPELGRLRPKRSISSDHVMEELLAPANSTITSSPRQVTEQHSLEEEDDSPYPEVRASVSNIDDPEMPALTFRVWAMGLFLCMLAASANTFFNFRYPALRWLPCHAVPRWLGGGTFSFNPGPFNIKEHVLLYIMSNVATAPGYAMNVIIAAEEFYNIRLGVGWSICLMIATQLTGFGLAGMCRRYLVQPASMIWPQNLVVCTLLNTLHAEDDEPARAESPIQVLPLCVRRRVFGSFCRVFVHGLVGVFVDMLVPSDIHRFAVDGSWWAEVHVMLGFIIFYWILAPIMYYKNVWNFAYLPMSTGGPYDRFGKSYDILRVIDIEHHSLNVTAYEEYSRLYLPATYAITYLLAFSISTAVLVHTILYHGPTLLAGIKNLRIEEDDVHARLMRHYPEVPDWWYLLSLAIFFALAMISALVWPTGMPWWGMPFSLLLPTVYIVPIAYVYAMTGQPLNINLLAEVIPGSLIPGKPLPNMIFKSYAVQSLAEALTFVQDLKLGHYIKVSPRATFMVQMVSTLMSAFVQVGVKEWMFRNVKDICKDTQPQKLTCPHNRVYFTASAVWGLIGPTRTFGQGATYHPQLSPVSTSIRNMPVLLNGPMWIPPATGINYSSWFVIGFLFQYVVRRRNFRWWSKFNYALSAALDSAPSFRFFLFSFVYNSRWDKGSIDWWGNTVHMNTADYMKLPYLKAPPKDSHSTSPQNSPHP
ncbi:OPT oligopeptide transporter protein [Rhizoctonia solani]|uniref:OPT oligopeptide transporter protein n=1 Tax=Rhizoctonia solani TaxID=456999 RepID=A0A8H8NRY1_9AGAM|nr:OPT oligopeptide transporter protein [Rhizoctonia solani]QRW17658.1 OPT oligopeptide transporter protein [Rhizoctonia solani]